MNANSTAPQRSHTQTQARGLRKLLEELEDLQISRSSIVAQAKRLVVQDDIKPRILRHANGLERWTEVDPAMFESIIDDELSKYDRFKDTLQEGREQQEDLISRIKVWCSSMTAPSDSLLSIGSNGRTRMRSFCDRGRRTRRSKNGNKLSSPLISHIPNIARS